MKLESKDKLDRSDMENVNNVELEHIDTDITAKSVAKKLNNKKLLSSWKMGIR